MASTALMLTTAALPDAAQERQGGVAGGLRTPENFRSSSSRQSSAVVSAKRFHPRGPALLTRPSRPPKRSAAGSVNASTPLSRTSQGAW